MQFLSKTWLKLDSLEREQAEMSTEVVKNILGGNRDDVRETAFFLCMSQGEVCWKSASQADRRESSRDLAWSPYTATNGRILTSPKINKTVSGRSWRKANGLGR